MQLQPRDKLGPYEILALIGKGGMGEVYKAHDPRLGRDVAIKVSAQQFSDRFEREARAIAALNHPNICQVYDIGPNYLVMEFIEGTPLDGPLPTEVALHHAVRICEALAAAHAKGITHRDLKPANILVTASGIKLLDFGLALLSGSRPTAAPETTVTMGLTRAGTVLGTTAYMSPEQAEAKAVDGRSDIFSFGLVLYEMLSGRRAFTGDSAIAIMANILHKEPEPLDAPSALQTILARCLRKSPAARFQSITEVKDALLAANSGVRVAIPAQPQPSIAVLPFANMSGDAEDEYFADGLAEEIINALTQVAGLKVIARTSAFAFKGKNEDIRKIAETLGVTNVLEGSVRRGGSRIRVTAQLIHAADGTHLWSQRYDREMADAFAIQDEISVAIADQLKVRLTGRKQSAVHPEAYQAYLEGRHYMYEVTPAGMAKSLECLERAIRLDPNYAVAWAALAHRALLQAMNGLARPRDVVPAAVAAVTRALELNPETVEAHYIRAMVHIYYEWNWRAADEDLARAVDLNPALAEAHMGRSMCLANQGRNEQALAEMRRAVELNPVDKNTRRMEILVLSLTGAGAQAVERLRVLLDLFGGYWLSWWSAAIVFDKEGLYNEAAAAVQKGMELSPNNALFLSELAWIRGRQGRLADSRSLRAELEELAAQQYVPFWARAVAGAGCGDMDGFYRLMDQALDEREPVTPLFLVDHRLEFQADPRYRALLHRINLE